MVYVTIVCLNNILQQHYINDSVLILIDYLLLLTFEEVIGCGCKDGGCS